MDLFSYLTVGSFVIIDLIAATTNAFNGALLAQRPDYYQTKHWTMVGIILMGLFGGIGGGITRDLLLGKTPAALENPWYLILCIAAGIAAIILAYDQGQNFRERLYQFATAFSLPWYAAIGTSAAITAGLPTLSCILLGIVGPTAGRYLIDITAERPAKQFVRGEWFVGTAVLTSVVYLLCARYLGMTEWPSTLISFGVGFVFRLAALWFLWEEPFPCLPLPFMVDPPKRISLRGRLRPGWNALDEYKE